MLSQKFLLAKFTNLQNFSKSLVKQVGLNLVVEPVGLSLIWYFSFFLVITCFYYNCIIVCNLLLSFLLFYYL